MKTYKTKSHEPMSINKIIAWIRKDQPPGMGDKGLRTEELEAIPT